MSLTVPPPVKVTNDITSSLTFTTPTINVDLRSTTPKPHQTRPQPRPQQQNHKLQTTPEYDPSSTSSTPAVTNSQLQESPVTLLPKPNSFPHGPHHSHPPNEMDEWLNAPPAPAPGAPGDDGGQEREGLINDKLASLRFDELVAMGHSRRGTKPHHRRGQTTLGAIWVPLEAYLKYLYVTWSNILATTMEVPLADLLLTIAFALLTSVILFLGLIWCQIWNLPLVETLYTIWSNKYANGLGLANSGNPRLFEVLTKKEAEIGKVALSRTGGGSESGGDGDGDGGLTVRELNLDIAKLLLQFSCVVYERESHALYNVLDEVEKHSRSGGHLKGSGGSLTSRSGRGRVETATRWASKELERGNVTLTGLRTPDSRSFGAPSSSQQQREEKPVVQHFDGVTTMTRAKPGELVKSLFDNTQEERIRESFMQLRTFDKISRKGSRIHTGDVEGEDDEDDEGDEDDRRSSSSSMEKRMRFGKIAKGEDVIRRFCRRIGVAYEPVSELNTSQSAFCSFFWEPKGNWIAVTFKGTGLTEYADWVSDLSTTLVPVDDFLPGFSQAVKGFKERIFPEDLREVEEDVVGGMRPYETIRFALKALANYLARDLDQGEKINVWFTGHSLGCALATLVYARALNSPSDFEGSPIIIRDAYLFAAPVCGDRETSLRFNQIIKQPGEHLKTMWRVTNDGDAIATLLPQLGDNPRLKLSSTNPAGFAHLGAEIKMKNRPVVSNVTGSLYSRDDTIVRIYSHFSKEDIQAIRDRDLRRHRGEWLREKVGVWVTKIPLLGRFIAHSEVLYWDQLNRIALGKCKWLDEYS
ncbi:uncharacterized protein EI90DRAFT_457582 [Cantharellus anzutake]|uniref:uncharacterized protein n=1 Tax=Cantharellus anzutake TaxID=1750568 RepID=UPI001907E137|nr:uncharacterized protein EI90DRAFT_457582 [Cantharellus anzutake]KAF8334723.1 hypothetical protein EI90DRAFT_457582 [Cantharellus anzutake]